MREVRLLSTSAILGYGFPEASLRAGLDRRPHVIGVDGGSVDPGPHYLGIGKPVCSPIALRPPPTSSASEAAGVNRDPHYLDTEKPFCSPIAIRRDLRLMLNAAVRHGIP